jgi:hypothetical protein
MEAIFVPCSCRAKTHHHCKASPMAICASGYPADFVVGPELMPEADLA